MTAHGATVGSTAAVYSTNRLPLHSEFLRISEKCRKVRKRWRESGCKVAIWSKMWYICNVIVLLGAQLIGHYWGRDSNEICI